MKTSIKQSLLSAALLLAALATQAATHVDSLLNCLHNPKSNYVFVIAHRLSTVRNSDVIMPIGVARPRIPSKALRTPYAWV